MQLQVQRWRWGQEASVEANSLVRRQGTNASLGWGFPRQQEEQGKEGNEHDLLLTKAKKRQVEVTMTQCGYSSVCLFSMLC